MRDLSIDSINLPYLVSICPFTVNLTISVSYATYALLIWIVEGYGIYYEAKLTKVYNQI